MISIKHNGITKELNVTKFPDKTSQVWNLDIASFNKNTKVSILWEFEDEGELFHICQLAQLLKHLGVRATLDVPYLPYARQDKIVSNESCFALTTFANILNSCEFTEIHTRDVHSEIASELIPKLISRTYFDNDNLLQFDYICFPDEGAADRYEGYDFIHSDRYKSIYLKKDRDPKTGEIKNISLDYIAEKPKDNFSVIILDDLCDRGGTFVGAAKVLRDLGAESVALYTTHGIYSDKEKGVNFLFDNGIDRVFNRKGEILKEN